MRSTKLAGILGLLALVASPAHSQTVIDFESVAACDNVSPNMGVFAGVDFRSEWTCYSFAQPPYNPSSGTNRLYAVSGSSNASTGSFAFSGPQAFLGAFFAGSADVTFNMYLGNTLVASSSTLTTTSTPTFLSSGYAGNVDEVQVVGNSVQWIMDDLTYGSAVSVVPEPGSILLVALGLAGVAAVRRRRQVS